MNQSENNQSQPIFLLHLDLHFLLHFLRPCTHNLLLVWFSFSCTHWKRISVFLEVYLSFAFWDEKLVFLDCGNPRNRFGFSDAGSFCRQWKQFGFRRILWGRPTATAKGHSAFFSFENAGISCCWLRNLIVSFQNHFELTLWQKIRYAL